MICCIIESVDLIYLIDCFFFVDNVIVVIDCLFVEVISGEVKVMIIKDVVIRKVFNFDSVSGIKFFLDCMKLIVKLIFLII